MKLSKRGMSVLGLCFALVCGTAALVYADKPKPPTEEQLHNIEEIKERDKFRAMPKCEGDVILEMGNVRLKVPRGGQHVYASEIGDINGLDRPGPNYSCDQDSIKNVLTYRVGGLTIGNRPNQSVETSYKSAHENFKRRNMALDRSREDNGVERIRIVSVHSDTLELPEEGSASEYFVLPIDIAPTETGEPVLYTCEMFPESGFHAGVRCMSSYYHPTGLYISANFPRHEPGTAFIIKKDQEIREFISNAFVNSRQ